MSVTVEWVRKEALGTLGEWLAGYSAPDSNGVQRRIVAMEWSEDGPMKIKVTGTGHDVAGQAPQHFFVDVTVRMAGP
jgi:hypothetical protein